MFTFRTICSLALLGALAGGPGLGLADDRSPVAGRPDGAEAGPIPVAQVRSRIEAALNEMPVVRLVVEDRDGNVHVGFVRLHLTDDRDAHWTFSATASYLSRPDSEMTLLEEFLSDGDALARLPEQARNAKWSKMSTIGYVPYRDTIRVSRLGAVNVLSIDPQDLAKASAPVAKKRPTPQEPAPRIASGSPPGSDEANPDAPPDKQEFAGAGIRFDGVYREHFADRDERQRFGFLGRYYLFQEDGTMLVFPYGRIPEGTDEEETPFIVDILGGSGDVVYGLLPKRVRSEEQDVLWLPRRQNDRLLVIPHDLESEKHAAEIAKWLADESNRAFRKQGRRYTVRDGSTEFERTDAIAPEEQLLLYKNGKFTGQGASFRVFIRNKAFDFLFSNSNRAWTFIPFSSPTGSDLPAAAGGK